MIKQIIQLNWRWSTAFAKKFPKICHDDFELNDFLIGSIEQKIKDCITKPSILEVGGIDRPLLNRSTTYLYDGLDVCYSPKCDEVYDNFYIQSVEETIANQYELVFSTTVLEHVPNNNKAITSIFNALNNQEGYTIHYIPNKYHLYALILKIVGTKRQKWLIKHLRDHSAHEVSGYPAFFSHCSPRKMKNLFTQIGFNNVQVKCIYSASTYFSFCFPLFVMVSLWECFCRSTSLKSACCGFIISAEKINSQEFK